MRDRRGGRRGSQNRRGRGRRSRSTPKTRQGEPERSTPLGAGVSEPEHAESIGSTLEEAIENALQVLGAREDEVDVQILEEGKRGFLGFGMKRPYRVRIDWQKPAPETRPTAEPSPGPPARESRRRTPRQTPRTRGDRRAPRRTEAPPPTPKAARDHRRRGPTSHRQSRARAAAETSPPRKLASPERLSEPRVGTEDHRLPELTPEQLEELRSEARTSAEQLLHLMGMHAEIETRIDDDALRVAIESPEDEALLIGRRGETRAALQQVLNRVLSKRRSGVFPPVLVDVAGYWERRVERLTSEAHELADRAVRSGLAAQSEPLSPQERRVIHRTLTEDPRVTTESTGKGLHKSVLVQPESSVSERS